MSAAYQSRAQDLHVHFGPAICGVCYEVGPEVHEALGLEVPAQNTPVDLRAVLAQRAIAAGVHAANVSTSTYCTRCSDRIFFSHRGGDAGRQMGLIGIEGE
jgi:copper oxidase (laccase) domain-containing protein